MRVTLMLLAAVVGSQAAAADDTVIRSGQIACTSEDELDAYLAATADAAPGPGSLMQYPTCRRFAESAPAVILVRHSRTRVRVQVTDGPKAGFSGWADLNLKR